MNVCGWIRFRASLMATRRISWIDQRINDGRGTVFVLLLPWSGVPFFGGGGLARWRITAIMAKASIPAKRGVPTHARICSRCDRPRTRFFAVSKLSSMPPMAFDRHSVRWMCRWTPGGEEGEIAIGDYDDGSTDRVSKDLDLRC